MIGKSKVLLYLALAISLITYLFWQDLPKGSFYIGNSLFISFLCLFIFLNFKKCFLTFVLLGFSLNNLLEELFFNPTKFEINEILVLIIVPLIWFLNNKKCL